MRAELQKLLREPHEESRAHDNWEAITRRRNPTPRVPTTAPVLGFALLFGLAVAFAIVGPRPPGPLVREDGHEARGVLAPDVGLDDGSRITLDPGARLEVLENTGDHVRFWLHDGVAHFDVVPGGPRRWTIETGLVSVEVLGTAFSVGRVAESVTVRVVRGTVLVRGPTAPDGMQRLEAGDSLTLGAGETIAAAEPSTEVSEPRAPSPEPRAARREARTTSPEVEGEGEDEPESPRLRDVDALRAAGRIDDAIALLDTIASDPSAGRERALAAFTAGRLELDRRDHPREAAAAFARAIDLGLRAPLLEDARARRVEAFVRASDSEAARDAADAYRRGYPSGRWSAQVDRWSPPP